MPTLCVQFPSVIISYDAGSMIDILSPSINVPDNIRTSAITPRFVSNHESITLARIISPSSSGSCFGGGTLLHIESRSWNRKHDVYEFIDV